MSEFYPILVPSPAETATQYKHVSHQLNLHMTPELSAGRVLARLEPRVQSIARGVCGIFPYAEPLSIGDMAIMYSESVTNTAKRVERMQQLVTAAINPAQEPVALRRQIPLEVIATMLNKHAETLTEADQELLRAMYGFPPYRKPQVTGVLERLTGLSKPGISTYENKLLTAMQGDGPIYPLRIVRRNGVAAARARLPQEPGAKARNHAALNAEHARLFRARDAGMYATMLLQLRPPEGRDAVATQLIQDLERRARYRVGYRKHSQKKPVKLQKYMPGKYSAASGEAPIDSRAERLAARRAHNPNIETAEGRKALIVTLTNRAESIPEADVALLQTVAQEGRDAVQQVKDNGIGLSIFVVAALRRRSYDPESNFWDEVSAANQGHSYAADRFDDSLQYVFASYAVMTMTGHILKARTRMRAAKAKYAKEISLNSTGPNQPDGPELHESIGTAEYFADIVDAETNDARTKALYKAFTVAGIDALQLSVLQGLFGIDPYSEPVSYEELAERVGREVSEVRLQLRLAKKKMLTSPDAIAALRTFLRPDGASGRTV